MNENWLRHVQKVIDMMLSSEAGEFTQNEKYASYVLQVINRCMDNTKLLGFIATCAIKAEKSLYSIEKDRTA